MLNSKSLFISVFIVFSTVFLSFSQKTHLFGNIPEYANCYLEFLTYSDFISKTEKTLAECKVKENGDFSVDINIEETQYVFLHLGIYEAFVFIEPHHEYELLFPERQDKTIAEELNPYFKEVKYHLGIDNSSEKELNYILAYFNYEYNNMINRNAYKIYIKASGVNVDDTIKKIDSIFCNYKNPYFVNYKKYKYAAFRHLSYQFKTKSISNSYYLNKNVLYKNTAYMELFNQVYDNYFLYFARTEHGKEIYKNINQQKSITALKSTLSYDNILQNDTLKEFVILKCLYDEFYNDKFYRSAMLTVLDSLRNETKIKEHEEIADNIYTKVTRLLKGFAPSEFHLYDTDSNLVSLDNFKGKYVYLGFCTSVSYACIQEFEMLRKLHERHSNDFEIVMICADKNYEQMKRFVDKKKYPWTFLYYGNKPLILKEYDIRAFPTYFLIDKEGKLLLSPAPSPAENLELTLFKIMKARGDL